MSDAGIHRLEEEIQYLRSLLEENGIDYDFDAFLSVRKEEDESLQGDADEEPKERELFSERKDFHSSDASGKVRIIWSKWMLSKNCQPAITEYCMRLHLSARL